MELITGERTRLDDRFNTAPLWLALVPEATCSASSAEDIQVTWPGGTLTFPALTPGLHAALDRFRWNGSVEDDLVDTAVAMDGPASLGRLYYHLDQLAGRGVLTYDVRDEQRSLVKLRGMTPDFRFRQHPLTGDTRLVASRFALLRRVGDGWLMESPMVPAELTGVVPSVPALFAMLAAPARVAGIVDMSPGIDTPQVLAVLQIMIACGIVEVLDEDGMGISDRSDALAQWSFHDLLFHTRSRYGRHDRPFGGTFRHLESLAPRPGVRPSRGGALIDLPPVNLDEIERRDMSLTNAIETRVSTRRFGDTPITLDQLGEFLYRVARVRSVTEYPVPEGSPDAVPMEVTSRPYPTGGASYELEFYVTVDQCDGLDRGMYHYHAAEHRLELVRREDRLTEWMVGFAGISAPGSRPQVLLTLAARFQRVSWKYDAIAYATIQKHVGIAYQMMYLVATAMGLGGCALGSGDADLFAKAAGTDYYEETSVGDFMLGSLPPSDSPASPVAGAQSPSGRA